MVEDVEDARTMEDVTGEDIDHIEYSALHKDLVHHYSGAEVKWIVKTHEQLGDLSCRALVGGARDEVRRKRGGAAEKVQLCHPHVSHLVEGDKKDGVHDNGRSKVA